MSTFHPFPRLPLELRAQIWEMTVEPRTVEVLMIRLGGMQRSPRGLFCRTPVPATLHSCWEARNHGLYEKKFRELSRNRPQNDCRYVWLNLDIDMIDISECDFKDYEPVAPTIKRLTFQRSNRFQPFRHWEGRDMKIFVNVQEIRVVCDDGLENWGHATHRYPWPCAIEKVTFIDYRDHNRTAVGLELEDIYRKHINEVRLAEDGRAWDSADDEDWPEHTPSAESWPEQDCPFHGF